MCEMRTHACPPLVKWATCSWVKSRLMILCRPWSVLKTALTVDVAPSVARSLVNESTVQALMVWRPQNSNPPR